MCAHNFWKALMVIFEDSVHCLERGVCLSRLEDNWKRFCDACQRVELLYCA